MDIAELATPARQASRSLACLNRQAKDAALVSMADALWGARRQILDANASDVQRAEQSGTPAAMIDRLRLDEDRLAAMAQALRDLASLPDPVGEVVRGWTLPNGAHVDQIRVPLGVVGIIYEARPNVTADAAGICLKSGNAALLRGSSSALASNQAIVAALRTGLENAGLPPQAVTLVEGGHEATQAMMRARGLIDVLIPRGGANLINTVVESSSVPVIETGTGNCHLYADASADQDLALAVIANAKTQRPSVCNALETLLVNQQIAVQFLPRVTDALAGAGVTLHGDPASVAIEPRIQPAAADEFDAEYLSLDLAVSVVPDLEAAIEHIRQHSTGHSETIITNDVSAQRRFVEQVDAAAVLVNTSSRFVDGGEFGFGAEIGISTQKLHARGPMGLSEMTTTKYVITGQGQTR